jgi:hypothetical protein
LHHLTLPSDAKLKQKFRWLVEPILGEKRTVELVGLIWQFEQVGEAQPLLDLCVTK